MTVDRELAANRANWDERVASHLVAYRVEEFAADPAALSRDVRQDLRLLSPHLPGGTPAGRSLVHLQCHIGMDTLSWARRGATVTGVDFSPAAVDAARELAERAGLAARFVVSDVDNAAAACGEEFDIVYTGVGALCWLPDLSSWARTVTALLRPGGVFYVRDLHPMTATVQYDDGKLTIVEPYFATGEPQRWDDGVTYADDQVRLTNAVTYEWPHALSEIVQSLLDAGLRLTSLREHRSLSWRSLPHMVHTEEGWILPDGRERLPLAFSLTATKP